MTSHRDYQWRLRDRVLTIGRRPLVMGIVNVTPDSFSDGGQFLSVDAAVAHGLQLVQDGADLLDIGGESTRPGASPVSLEEELQRVIPVIERLAAQVSVPISVDTSKAEVARQALAAGAAIINDVTALTGDPAMPRIALETGAGLVLMHMQGTPRTMQLDPTYQEVVGDVLHYLEERLAALAGLGIGAEAIAIDPGIGFGKRYEHNLDLLVRLAEFQRLGRPVCLGVSRKGFIGRALGRPGPVEQRSAGTLGVLLYCLAQGSAQIVRVHDVAAARDAITMFLTLEERAGITR
jgi:dihydropteroate synthase